VTEADGDRPPGPSRRRLLVRLAAVGGAVFAGKWVVGPFYDGNAPAPPERSEPRPFGEVGLGELWRTLPADTDRSSAGPAIDRELEALATHGRGGVLYLPPGEWTVDRAVRVLSDDVTITGAGMRATRLRLADDVRDHVVEVLADGVSIERLTIVGNGAASDREGLGHGIRAGDNAAHLLVRDVVVEDVQGYGIGLQPQAGDDAKVGGLFNDVVLRNVAVRGTGLDGIDIKNYDGDNEACPAASYEDEPVTPPGCNGRRSFLRNISVSGIAQHRPLRDQRGIDVRGLRLLQNIDVLDVPPTSHGVLFRTELGGTPNGRGGQWSTLEGFYISTEGSLEQGIFHDDLEGVEVHHGFVVHDDEVKTFA
jgi:hypothetical protein